MLVPEISLTPQIIARFKAHFNEDIAILHSGLSDGEKFDEYKKILRKEVKIVVGARSAIFAPFTNLGIIIIDEEHSDTYKQESNPRYDAKEVAFLRGKHNNAKVILGSATPTIESYARAKHGYYELVKLEKRANDASLPIVNIVDMSKEFKKNNPMTEEKKEKKAKVKTSKSDQKKNNEKACNCGKCDECKKNNKKENDDDEE